MTRICLCIALVMAVATGGLAQPPGDWPQGPGGPPAGFPALPGFALMDALDANHDGKITVDEIEHAGRALAALDEDQDGKLSPAEIGWPPGFGGGGPPAFGGGPFPGGGIPGLGGGPGPGGGRFPGFGGGTGPGGRPQRPDPDADHGRPTGPMRPGGGTRLRRFFSARQLRQLDRDNDGKVTREEIPELMRESILSRVDDNQDGVLDETELRGLDASGE